MRIDAPIFTGSFSLNGNTLQDLGSVSTTGSNAFVGNQTIQGFVSASALTGSINYTNLTSVPTLVSGGAQVINILTSINSATASFSPRITNLESKSASVDISVSNINSFTSSNGNTSLNSFSASNGNTSLNSLTGSYATTGSNSFFGTQVFSGSVFIANDLVVLGSSSIQYISASSVSIGTNIVQLNTATPSVRFAGLSVQDSGSSAGVTGSMLWDSLCNRWIYSNPSTIGYSGGMLLSGPRASTLGTETTLTCNYIAKSGGGDHLYDSCIQDVSGSVTIGGTLCTSGIICGNYLWSNTNIVVNDTLFTGGNIRKLNTNQCQFFRNAAGDIEGLFGGSGNFGIGNVVPNAPLTIDACAKLSSAIGKAYYNGTSGDTGCIFWGLGDQNSYYRSGMVAYQNWNGTYTDYLLKFTVLKGGVGNIDAISINKDGDTTFSAASLANDGGVRCISVYGSGTTAAVINGINIWNGVSYPAGMYVGKGTNAAGNLTFKVSNYESGVVCRNALSISETGVSCFLCQVASGGTFMSNVGSTTSTYGFTHCGSNGYYGRFGVPNSSYMYLETNTNSGVYIDSTTRTNCLSVNAAWSSGGGANQPLQVKSGVAGSGIWIESCSSDAGGYINMNGNCLTIGQSYRTSAGFNDILFQTAGNTRMTIRCEGNVEVETGLISPMFMVERNSAYDDIASGCYLSLNDTGTQGLNAKLHQQMSPVVNSGENMYWNCVRILLRMTNNSGTFSTGNGCIKNAAYFYTVGWYCFGTAVSVGNVMDGGRGFRWVVMPWLGYSNFVNGVDVPGLGIYNQYSDSPLRIGAVYIQYKR